MHGLVEPWVVNALQTFPSLSVHIASKDLHRLGLVLNRIGRNAAEVWAAYAGTATRLVSSLARLPKNPLMERTWNLLAPLVCAIAASATTEFRG